MNQDLTRGPVMRSMLLFAIPMILGDLLQQCYNVADTLIVGRFAGTDALAAVGSSYSLMTFLTSILLGLCMGSGALFSIRFGRRDEAGLKESIVSSFVLIAAVAVVLNLAAFGCLDLIRVFLQVPDPVWGLMRAYLAVIFAGIPAVFLYNYFASFLRAVGNSVAPLAFLGVSACLNILLDLWFVLGLGRGVAGAAEATVIAQYVSGLGITVYALARCPQFRGLRPYLRVRASCLREVASYSFLTCVQQSVMNLGILMVQGLVNSFGPTIMAAFAAAVKIDSFAYLPVQDFGNAFSTFIAQNYGAIRQRLLHLHRPELRRQTGRPDSGGAERGGAGLGQLRHCAVGSGVGLCRAPDGPLCGGRGDRRHPGRGPLPPCGGGLLLRHRLPVFALRPLPGPGTPRHERGAHRHLPGHPGGAGLSAVGFAGSGGGGHLVGGAHWVVFGRRCGGGLLPAAAGQPPFLGKRMTFPRSFSAPFDGSETQLFSSKFPKTSSHKPPRTGNAPKFTPVKLFRLDLAWQLC